MTGGQLFLAGLAVLVVGSAMMDLPGAAGWIGAVIALAGAWALLKSIREF